MPVYEKPKERKPAELPPGLPKVPNSLNKLVGKMLKPKMRLGMKLNLKKHHKVKFY